MEINKVYNMPCEELMLQMESESVDMILTDPPYGSTNCEWDKIGNIQLYFNEFLRIIKQKGVIVVTADMKLASKIITLFYDYFRYDWVWEKNRGSNFAVSKFQPIRVHEHILIFSKSAACFTQNNKSIEFNPQYMKGIAYKRDHRNEINKDKVSLSVMKKGSKLNDFTINDGNYTPVSVLRFIKENATVHPTQKPIKLFEYLINSYSKENDLIFDPFLGSGTTALACQNTKRNYIGCEIDKDYFDICNKRILANKQQTKLF